MKLIRTLLVAVASLFILTPHSANAVPSFGVANGFFYMEPYKYSIDEASCTQIAGWACVPAGMGMSHVLRVDVYLNLPAGPGRAPVAVAYANQPGEAAIAAECGGTSNHRFAINMTSILQGLGPTQVYVYLVNETVGNSLLINQPVLGGCAGPTPTPTLTPTNTPVNTPTKTPTRTPTNSPTFTPTNIPTHTPTRTPTHTPTNTQTATPVHTPTNTPTNTPTFTHTPGVQVNPSPTPTITPTLTPTGVPSPNPTPTPIPVVPKGECITINPNGTCTAIFGYTNFNVNSITLPVGTQNQFVPAPANRNQPTTFMPGTVSNAISVTGCDVRWELNGQSASVNTNSVRCQQNECSSIDISDIIAALDFQTIQQKNAVVNLLKRLANLSRNKEKTFINKTKKAASDLQVELWTKVWTQYPNPVVNCTDTQSCVRVSNVSVINAFASGSTQLLNYAKQAIQKIKKYTKSVRPADQKLLNKATQLEAENRRLLATLPRFSSKCN